MKCYRIKHIPTGLYYCPNKSAYDKTNFSKRGKIYASKSYALAAMKHNSICHVNKSQCAKIEFFEKNKKESCYSKNFLIINTRDEDWEIEEI